MKRWLIIGTLILAISYIASYRLLPWRRAERFRNAEVFVHIREFPHEWEARLFYPAGYAEWMFIRAYPRPWLPHPSWASYPQVLLMEAGDFRIIFPRDAFRKNTNASDN